MDQNLIQNIKVTYRKCFFNHIIVHEGEDILTTLKQFNLENPVNNLDATWGAITGQNIQKSWTPLWPESMEAEESDDENIPCFQLEEKFCPINQEDLKTLTVIDPENSFNSKIITDRAVGEKEHDTDLIEEELIDEALRSNVGDAEESAESNDDETEEKVKQGDAINAFLLGILQSSHEGYIAFEKAQRKSYIQKSANKT